MTVECPGCSTTFPVDPKKVPAGGVHARCSVCGEVFFVDAPAPVPTAAQPGTLPEAEAPPAPEEAWEQVAEPGDEVEAETHREESVGEETAEQEPSWAEPEAETAVEEPSWAELEEGVAEEEPSWAEPEVETAVEEPSWTGAPEPVSEEEPSLAELEEGVAEEDVPEPSFVPPTDEPLAETVEPAPVELSAPMAETAREEDQAPGEEVPDLGAVAGAGEEDVPWEESEPASWEEEAPDQATAEEAEAEAVEPPAVQEVTLEGASDREDLTEAYREDVFAEEIPILEAADAEGTFRVDETPAEEEFPFVGEVTPEGELAMEAGAEGEAEPELPEPPFQLEEPTFGEGELIFTMDTPGVDGDVEQAPGFALGSTSQEEDLQEDVPEVETPMEEPAPPPPPLPTPQFGRRDPKEKAQRLARVLVSDIILYNPDRHQRALEQGRLKEEFEDEIQKSWNEYVEQVGSEIANGTEFFTDALNEILAKGRKTF